jgi:hypothetical protein
MTPSAPWATIASGKGNHAAGPKRTTARANAVRQPQPERRVTTVVALPSGPLMMVVTSLRDATRPPSLVQAAQPVLTNLYSRSPGTTKEDCDVRIYLALAC